MQKPPKRRFLTCALVRNGWSELLLSFGNLLSDVSGHRFVVIEFHRERTATFRQRANRCCVTEHFRKWNMSIDDFQSQRSAIINAINLSATGCQIARCRTEKLIRNNDFNFHDWLQNDWLGASRR